MSKNKLEPALSRGAAEQTFPEEIVTLHVVKKNPSIKAPTGTLLQTSTENQQRSSP